jgi:hypothetical protein
MLENVDSILGRTFRTVGVARVLCVETGNRPLAKNADDKRELHPPEQALCIRAPWISSLS